MLGFLLTFLTGVGASAIYFEVMIRNRRRAEAAVAKAAAASPPTVIIDQASQPIATALAAAIKALTDPAEEVGDPRELVDMAAFQAVLAVMRRPDMTIDLLRQHALGAHWPAACAALAVLTEHDDRQSVAPDVRRALGGLRPYVLIYAFRYLLSLDARPPVGEAVLSAPEWWEHNPVIPGYFGEYFKQAQALGDTPGFGDLLARRKEVVSDGVLRMLGTIEHPFAAELVRQLGAWRNTRIDRDYLGTVGTVWDDAERDPVLVEPDAWRALLETGIAAIRLERPRSVLVTGEPRTGKTAFVELLSQRLEAHGWTLFAASGAELMAGQIYFGQLEGRIREVLVAVQARRRIVWYIPDFAQLADSGTHKGQASSVLDQIMPAIVAGQLIVIGEASGKAATRLFQLRPSLRALMEVVALEPMADAEAAELARAVCARIHENTALEISPGVVAAAADLAQHYLGSAQSPGAVLSLIKRTAARAIAEGQASLTAEAVVATLSQVSGLPTSILDTRQRMDLADIRGFFSRKVIGQDEAVRTLVDRIAMLKAGLTDPGKPIGVFLFAGPTGTGKTELAKTLAEFLFGSPDRIVRLDMSEFQTAESTVKILGQRGETAEGDALIDRIRKQPFSVVLLDEFEKAHSNCWDLFLQIFDDGRLSDANGREADFRHTIIILTSNLGASAHQGAGIGFGQRAGGFTDDQVLKTIGQTFRPEFINRLDKVVVFQPLSRELMRGILNKELAHVLERRGLRDRDWAVEWEASAIEFLLDRGFSPTMGARPLKRAIDQHLLAPLAATLVEHRAPEGDQFLFVRADGTRIDVEFVDPNAQDDTGATDTPPASADGDLSLQDIVLRPLGAPAEAVVVNAAWRTLSDELASDAWRAPTDALRLKLADPAIWSRPDRFRTFSAVELADRVEEAARTAERLHRRYAAAGAEQPSRELTGRLAMQLHNLRQGMDDLAGDAPVDAVLRIDPALDTGEDSGEAQAWRVRLFAMYRQWATRRRMQVREIAAPGRGAAPVLVVTGFGAFRTLEREAGLHVLEEESEDSSRRIAARVVVASGPDQPPDTGGEDAAILQRLSAAKPSKTIVRRYRERPAPLVRDLQGGWRSGRLDAVLAGDFDLIGMIKRQASADA